MAVLTIGSGDLELGMALLIYWKSSIHSCDEILNEIIHTKVL
jgi:hypothetical protein